MLRGEHRERLIDDVLLIRLQMLHPALFDELDDPAWIEIDAEADAAAELAEMLDGEAQPPRSARAKHQPVRSFGKVLLRQRRAELLVVDAKIVDDDAALRNAGGAAGLEDVGGLAPQGLGLPAPNRP